MPKLAEFMESLTQEQDKLVMMGTIKASKDEALVVGDSRVDSKGNKKIKWQNTRDDSYGILCLTISRDLLFHLDGLTSANEVWENLVDHFGKKDEMRGHQIKNELISLIPSSFESLQLYFSKFKALVLQLK